VRRSSKSIDLVLRLDCLEIIGACLSSKEERVVLHEINIEPRYVGGLVMLIMLICMSRRLNVRNEGVNVNGVKTTKERKVGRERGVRPTESVVNYIGK